MFLGFGAHCNYWICEFIVFLKFRKTLAIIFFKCFNYPLSPLSFEDSSIIWLLQFVHQFTGDLLSFSVFISDSFYFCAFKFIHFFFCDIKLLLISSNRCFIPDLLAFSLDVYLCLFYILVCLLLLQHIEYSHNTI